MIFYRYCYVNLTSLSAEMRCRRRTKRRMVSKNRRQVVCTSSPISFHSQQRKQRFFFSSLGISSALSLIYLMAYIPRQILHKTYVYAFLCKSMTIVYALVDQVQGGPEKDFPHFLRQQFCANAAVVVIGPTWAF